MGLKAWFKSKVRSFLGVTQLEADIHHLHRRTEHLQETDAQIQQIAQRTEELLGLQRRLTELHESLKDDKFIMALEYPPSRDYRPRWGYTHPVHPGLTDFFNQSKALYLETAHRMAALQPYFAQINSTFPNENPIEPGWVGGAINAIDTAFLYYFMTELKPKTYLEIGSGVTTLFAARAKRDHQLSTQIISIDPQPRAEVDAVCDRIIRTGLEVTDLSIFAELEAGDIVFMDGSHRSFMNSDVTVFMLDVLPLLKPGVVVHFHDIQLPFDYPDMFSSWYWNEQYILAAYLLAGKNHIQMLMPSRFVSEMPEFKQAMQPILSEWSGQPEVWLCGGSIWFTHR